MKKKKPRKEHKKKSVYSCSLRFTVFSLCDLQLQRLPCHNKDILHPQHSIIATLTLKFQVNAGKPCILLILHSLKQYRNMQELLDNIDKTRLPKHVAIIMDGNGRWAKEKGQDRLYGHFHGVESVRNIVEGCAELGVEYLTLYAFSTENWDRPEYEVTGLIELLVETIRKETETLNKNNIRLHVIGDVKMLPEYAQKELNESLEITSHNAGLNLVMALSYSSR